MDKILIIGGTGTLGLAFIDAVYKIHQYQITVLSRDEQKQQKLKSIYPHVKFVIGDIRDKSSMDHHFIGIKYVFNFAALKHIDVCEANPMESVKTNILGANNVAELCIKHKVKRCVFSSTDKAVDPISVYGYSKAISENIYLDLNRKQDITTFIVYRWPNVTASNGSFINVIVDKMRNYEPIPVTHEDMSRFWIKIETAVDFVLATFKKEFKPSEVLVPTFIKSASILEIIDAIADMLVLNYTIKIIGIRGVEKLSESLFSIHSDKFIDSKHIETRFTKEQLKEFLNPIVDKIINRG